MLYKRTRRGVVPVFACSLSSACILVAPCWCLAQQAYVWCALPHCWMRSAPAPAYGIVAAGRLQLESIIVIYAQWITCQAVPDGRSLEIRCCCCSCCSKLMMERMVALVGCIFVVCTCLPAAAQDGCSLDSCVCCCCSRLMLKGTVASCVSQRDMHTPGTS